MKIEEKEICQELNVTEKACSMAMYLFLRTIFSKEEFSDTVTEEFRWIVEEFSKAQTEPALLKTLWNELISGPYMNDDDPKLSMRCVKDELSELGYDWAITTPICQVLYKMHEIYLFIEDETKPLVQLWKLGDKCTKMTNAFTRMMDFQTGHIEPYFYARKSEEQGCLDILTSDYFVGTLRYHEHSVVQEMFFDRHVVDSVITDDMQKFSQKLIGRCLSFPEFQEDAPANGSAMEPENKRLIAITHGTKLYDELTVWETNAPRKYIDPLTLISTEIYLDGGNYGDIPDLYRILTSEGYLFELVDRYQHTPTSWKNPWDAEENSKEKAKKEHADIAEWYYTGPWE